MKQQELEARLIASLNAQKKRAQLRPWAILGGYALFWVGYGFALWHDWKMAIAIWIMLWGNNLRIRFQ